MGTLSFEKCWATSKTDVVDPHWTKNGQNSPSCSPIAEQGKISLVVEATFLSSLHPPQFSMLPLLIFDAFYFHDEWGPNELSHTIHIKSNKNFGCGLFSILNNHF